MTVQLVHGDCLKILPALAAGSVSAVIADLPYGTTENRWDVCIPMVPLWEQYWRLLKPNGAVVLTSQQPFASYLVQSALKWFRYEIIYEKTMALGILNANRMPLRAHENVLIFYRSLPTYNPQKTQGHPYHRKRLDNVARFTHYGHQRTGRSSTLNTGDRYPRSVVKMANPNHKSLHPTAKPVALMEYLIRTFTNEGETVLDNAMGSGTTGAACVQTGRNFIGIEIDEGYFCIASTRIAEAEARLI